MTSLLRRLQDRSQVPGRLPCLRARGRGAVSAAGSTGAGGRTPMSFVPLFGAIIEASQETHAF